MRSLDVTSDGVHEILLLHEEELRLYDALSGVLFDTAPAIAYFGRLYQWDLSQDGLAEAVIEYGTDYVVVPIRDGRLDPETYVRLDENGWPVNVDGDELDDFNVSNPAGEGIMRGVHRDTAIIRDFARTLHQIALIEREGMQELVATDGTSILLADAILADGERFAVGDVDGDLDADIVFASGAEIGILTDESGIFVESARHVVGRGIEQLAVGGGRIAWASMSELGLIDAGGPVTSTITAAPSAMLFEGDDLLLLDQESSALMALDANLQVRWRRSTIERPTALTAADFDGDGSVEHAVASAAGQLQVFRNDQSTTITIFRDGIELDARDLDGDGDLDLAALHRLEDETTSASADSSGLATLVINESGELQPSQPFFVRGPPTSMALADVDGDGAVDLMVAGGGRPRELGYGPHTPAVTTYLAHH